MIFRSEVRLCMSIKKLLDWGNVKRIKVYKGFKVRCNILWVVLTDASKTYDCSIV